jgi:hypothetical protein
MDTPVIWKKKGEGSEEGDQFPEIIRIV